MIESGRVVLSAGTYGSPALLLRSGVGPAAHLRSVGVPVAVDLPGVGENLVDHPAVDVDCGYCGPGRSAPSLHAIATFRSAVSMEDEPPDLMLWLTDPDGDSASFEVTVVLLKPRSRGRVLLRTSAASEQPSIELPSLGERSDVERLAEGYRRALEVANAPGLRRLCRDVPAKAPADGAPLLERIRGEAYSLPHAVGTCSMGTRPDAGAVVDALGSVHGTDGLSVVDASVMPDVPSGFTHIPTIMIAERLSEHIAALL